MAKIYESDQKLLKDVDCRCRAMDLEMIPARETNYVTPYDIAIRHGFQGTEEEWLESINGKDGESGITVPIEGFFSLEVDKDGYLYAYTADDTTEVPFDYDPETGNLYYVTEE